MDQRYFSGICEYNKVGRQDKTIQDKTRQDKARQGKYNHKVYIVAAKCQCWSKDLTKNVWNYMQFCAKFSHLVLFKFIP